MEIFSRNIWSDLCYVATILGVLCWTDRKNSRWVIQDDVLKEKDVSLDDNDEIEERDICT